MDTFVGRYLLAHTRHVFSEHGYRTEFRMGGPQDQSLLGLAGVGAAHAWLGGWAQDLWRRHRARHGQQ